VVAVRASSEAQRCRRCGGRLVQRTDDSDGVVLKRLKVYHQQSKPLVEYYKSRPTFRSINGAQPPDRVAVDLATAIESARSSYRPVEPGPGDATPRGVRS
jgi:adenylate kinase